MAQNESSHKETTSKCLGHTKKKIPILNFVVIIVSVIAAIASGASLYVSITTRAQLMSSFDSVASAFDGHGSARDDKVDDSSDNRKKTIRKTEGEGEIDGWHVKFVSVDSSRRDFSGAATIVLTYQVTNSTGDNENPPSGVKFQAFQNGQALRHATFGDAEPDNYDFFNQLQDGVTMTLTTGFKLLDDSAPVTIEIEGLSDNASKTVISKQFSLQ
ncbi:hypothetical protein Corgl_0948 [Coriobacterium glomerans PW2]|uniref:DUF5067 domain-containing protein n=1 Tax=Coriobacterium glomerans (strain ATCC 49209 / DSM 20642 / JCM 10262 / PW2) TaxID=700015 RepID=F2N7U7_CORGP|nr:DUF5067 domain-containing protein [Coriobacterium glomerans]AEB07056.1 hypothetical protein Corgl_0948 [Coriobacterium glomerans PW2]